MPPIGREGLGVRLTLRHAAIDEIRDARLVRFYTAFLAALAEGFAGAGQVAPGLAVIDEALARCEKSEERWIIADLLRIKGELILLQDAPNAAVAAQDHFQKSLE